MRIFAIFDSDGLPKGFFTPVVHSEIPDGSVQISKEQWHEFISHKGRRRWDGEKVVEYFPPPCSTPVFYGLLDQAISTIGIFIIRFKYLTR